MNLFLGIDTSCYTTSLCLVDSSYHVVADERIILSVKSGERGLSQSNMVYQHMRNLPVLFERLVPYLANSRICAIGVTNKPRRREDSYMPAFLAGFGYARSLAAVLHIPIYPMSHQENHLMAVLRDIGMIPEQPFYGLHLSGGTTDMLKSVPDSKGLDITRIGGTSDISAGQFIDRIGVALGFPFPAGVYVDKMAQDATMHRKAGRVWCQQGELSYSGPESQAQRQIAKGNAEKATVCQWTLATIWDGLRRMMDQVLPEESQLTAAGGVMSNQYLRQQLELYCVQKRIRLYLAPDGYSADNSSGVAFWAAWQEGNK